MDHTEFVRYDSNADNPRYKPRVRWMEREELEYWERITRIAEGNEQDFRDNLKNALLYYNQKENGE